MSELGDLISRKYYLSEIEKDLDGLPEGLYVTVHYQSTYANTDSAEEIVILTQLNNGQWSVHGYGYEYQLKKPTKLSLFTGNPYFFVVLIRLELETILPTQ